MLILFYALSGVAGPFCGQNKGAGDYDRRSRGAGVQLWDLVGLFVATAFSNCVVALIAYLWLGSALRSQAEHSSLTPLPQRNVTRVTN